MALDIPVSVGGSEEQLVSKEFRSLIELLPDLCVIIEHLGHPDKYERYPYARFREVLALARYPNTYVKVGGLGEICGQPYPFRQPHPFAYVPPFVEMAYEAFGPTRMMWGSDFPGVSHREGYGNAFQWLSEHVTSFCGEQAREWLLGGEGGSP